MPSSVLDASSLLPGSAPAGAAPTSPADDQLLTALFNDSPTPRMLIGPGGRLMRVNRALCAMVGYTNEELLATSVRALNDPAENDEFAGEMARLWRGETDAIRREKRYISKDGSVTWGELTATRVTDALDGTVYVQAVVVETTDKHRAESALRSSEERYRDLVEKLPGYAYLCGLGETGTTYYSSPRVKDLFGYEPSQYLSEPRFWANSLHPDDRARVLAEFAENARTDAGFRVEYRIHDAAGCVR